MSADPQKTFYLEVFGCQMNVHDSEKVVGTLLAQGYRQVPTVEEAGLVLYNTCSIRDKAEQKVFHRLADYKKLQKQGKRFGVLGCVAQQEGEKVFERAPHVSLVCGSASYRNLPHMLVQLEAGKRVTGLDWVSYPILRFKDHPNITYTITQRLDLPSSGAGEPPDAAIPAAIANAFFDATGVRIKETPLTPARVRNVLRAAGK